VTTWSTVFLLVVTIDPGVSVAVMRDTWPLHAVDGRRAGHQGRRSPGGCHEPQEPSSGRTDGT
jgi:hypothetical protein